MESKILKSLVVLGVPGVSLGVFYLLLRSFHFEFSAISPAWSGVVAVLFLLVVAIITIFALHQWGPKRMVPEKSETDRGAPDKKSEDFTYTEGEVVVTYDEMMRSLMMDVVKVNAHDHMLGVAAEYAWIDHNYPDCKRDSQALTTLELMTSDSGYSRDQIHFDRISIELSDGRKKDVYFDISAFYSRHPSLTASPSEFASKKLAEIYGVGG